MTQVSKFPLEKQIEVQIQEMFSNAICFVNEKGDVEKLLDDILTPTERVMLAKRLGIAVLLEKGYDYREISEILKVSTTTITTVAKWKKMRGGGYRKVVGMLLAQENWGHFFELVG